MTFKGILISLIFVHLTVGIYGSFDQNNFDTKRIAKIAEELKEATDFFRERSDVDDTKRRDSTIFDIRIDALPEECQVEGIPVNCAEATACTKRSGYYNIKLPQFSNESFLVECDAYTDGGDWTVIQRRQDGSVDFYRPWADYKVGFGDIDGEFFIGLDKLHALTNFDGHQELLIYMENVANKTALTSAWAKYDSFAISGECDKYVLKRIGKYSGTAGDSLQEHIRCKFSTKDQDNDNHVSMHCAEKYMGGWWYNWCHRSNLNGHYRDETVGKGITWYTLSGDEVSLKYVKMMIRRRRY